MICRQVRRLFYRQAVRNRYLKRDSGLAFRTSYLLLYGASFAGINEHEKNRQPSPCCSLSVSGPLDAARAKRVQRRKPNSRSLQ